MRWKHVAMAAVVAGAVGACRPATETPPQAVDKNGITVMTKEKQQVVDLLKSLETGAPGPLEVLSPTRYVQHNLDVADGVEGVRELVRRLPRGATKVNTVRVFQDGDFVFAHSEYDFFGPKVGFDIFRFEGGKIVEHWDNLQDVAAKPNPGGHTMTDGPTQATDLEKSAANKELVRSYIDDTLVNGKLDRMAAYFDGDNYIQHNPNAGDGLKAPREAFKARAEKGVTLAFDKVHKTLGEGSFVLAISEGRYGPAGGKHTCFYDLFRVEGGKIVEHWDTVAEIPDEEPWKNANGKFGF
jgi:predicted SnoaL-like aldol condensation-catalyzing enzyme